MGRLAVFFDKLQKRRSLRRWTKIAEQAGAIDLGTLRGIRTDAKLLQRQLDRVVNTVDSRLTLPMIGSNSFPKPMGTDWSYRPEIWRGPLRAAGAVAVETKTPIGSEASIFHDCKVSELTVRQIRNTREKDLAPFGLRMDVFHFDGSFLSLVIDLPPDAVAGLERRHLIRMACIVELEKPLEIYARLNVKHGPNVEQVVRELPLNEEEIFVEFDLAYTRMNEKRVEKMWVDLIFEGPELNQIILRDVNLSRRPRAEL